MQVNNSIIKLEDIIKVSAIMSENGFSDRGIVIHIPIKTQELLNKINEDLYYKNTTDEEKVCPNSVDEIVVNINGITFKYILDNGAE